MAGLHRNTPTSEVASSARACWRSTGLTAAKAPRVRVGCVPVERWKTKYICYVVPSLRYRSLRAKYGSDLGFQLRSMRTITTEASQLALGQRISEIWETGYVALWRTTLKRTREGDGDLRRRHRKNSELLSMVPPLL
jgi:hypothetical protein